MACDIVVCGSVRRGRALLRSGAKPGDTIYVSGALGGPASRSYPVRFFEPRLKLGARLRASACIDITDGLALDLHRLCAASGVSGKIVSIPIVPGSDREPRFIGW